MIPYHILSSDIPIQSLFYMNNFKSNIYFSQWNPLIARLAFKFLKGPKFTDKNANY